jgi:hypothetical protein
MDESPNPPQATEWEEQQNHDVFTYISAGVSDWLILWKSEVLMQPRSSAVGEIEWLPPN